MDWRSGLVIEARLTKMSYLDQSEFTGGFGFDSLESWAITRAVLAELLYLQPCDIRPHTTLPDLFAPFDKVVVVALCNAFEIELDRDVDEEWLCPFFNKGLPLHTAGDLARALQDLMDMPEEKVEAEEWAGDDG